MRKRPKISGDEIKYGDSCVKKNDADLNGLKV